jgi:hypothetical protein
MLVVLNPASRAGSFSTRPSAPAAAPIPDALATQADRVGVWPLVSGSAPSETLRPGRVGLDRRLVVPAGWRVTDAWLELDAGVAGTQTGSARGIAVTLNGDVLDEVPLTALAGNGPGGGVIEVALPAELVSSGANHVGLDLLGGAVEEQIGVVIGPASRVVADLAPALVGGVDEAAAALGPIGDTPRVLTMLLPADAGEDLLDAAAALAQLAARSEGPNPRWRVVTDRRKLSTANGPVVALVRDQDPLAEVLALSSDRPAAAALTQPGWAGGEPVLVVGGSDDEAIAELAAGLLDPGAPVVFRDAVAFLGGDVVRRPEPPALDMTLADLGYADRTVGCGGTLMVLFDIAAERATAGADVRLWGMTDLAEGSEVQVFLNGYPQPGLRPAAGARSLDATIALDPDDIRPGRNSLRLEVGGSCAEATLGTLTVDDTSTISVRRARGPARANLDDLPAQFAAESDTAELTVVLPLEPTVDDVAIALDAISALAGPGARYAPRLSVPDLVDGGVRMGHLLLLGERARQPMLDLFGERLPISARRLDDPTRLLLDGAGTGLTSNVGVVQMVRSPYESEHQLLVVTGTSESGYRAAAAALVEPDLAGSLIGSAALVTVRPDGSIEADSVRRRELPESNSGQFSDAVDGIPTAVRIPVLIGAGLGMAVLSYRVRRQPHS